MVFQSSSGGRREKSRVIAGRVRPAGPAAHPHSLNFMARKTKDVRPFQNAARLSSSAFFRTSVCRNTNLPKEKTQPISKLLDGSVDGAAAGVAVLACI